jgi:tripartite-type tricarboxylate transporter receptor subunit TctC
MRRLFRYVLLSALAWLPAAQAQQFPVPGRSITFIYGFPPGTPGDVYLRLAGPRLTAALGVPVTVENRVGATGNLAAEAVARAPADGHTVAAHHHEPRRCEPAAAAHADRPDARPAARHAGLRRAQRPHHQHRAAPAIHRLPQPDDGVARRSPAGSTTPAAASAPPRTWRPRSSSRWPGSTCSTCPYRGGPPAMIALYQGEVEFFFYQSGTVIEDMRAGRVRILGITSAERHPQIPEVPTVAEACDMPGFVSTTWHGLMVPAGTPASGRSRG